jgi:hypothetical protein
MPERQQELTDLNAGSGRRLSAEPSPKLNTGTEPKRRYAPSSRPGTVSAMPGLCVRVGRNADANRRDQIGHLAGLQMRKLPELGTRAVGLLNEDAVQGQDVQVWIESITVPLCSCRRWVLQRWVVTVAFASTASLVCSDAGRERVMRARGPSTSRISEAAEDKSDLAGVASEAAGLQIRFVGRCLSGRGAQIRFVRFAPLIPASQSGFAARVLASRSAYSG